MNCVVCVYIYIYVCARAHSYVVVVPAYGHVSSAMSTREYSDRCAERSYESIFF